jgi:chromosome segregation ATPase
MTIWALIAYVLGAAVVGTLIGCAVSQSFRRNVLILLGKGNNKLTTPIDRELALIAEQEEIVSKASRKASDLRGTLNNERNKLADKERALTAANGDLDLAISMAKGKNAAITDEQLEADPIVQQQAANVQAATSERDIQAQTVASIEQTVAVTKQAVTDAQAKLKELQLTVKSHEAKAKATSALRGAADVVDSFKGMNSTGAKIAREGDKVNEEFEQAKAQLEDAQGPQAQRDFEAAKRAQGLGSIIKGRTQAK